MKENLFLDWKVINRQARTMKLRCFINLNVINKTLVDYGVRFILVIVQPSPFCLFLIHPF